MRAKLMFWKSAFSSWETRFQEAADFASQIPADRLISFSHTADRDVGVITVWYWADDERDSLSVIEGGKER
jgi:hypothetical protein